MAVINGLRFIVILGAMSGYVQNLRVQRAIEVWYESPFEIDAVILSGNTKKNKNIHGGGDATESVQMLRGMQGEFARSKKVFPRDRIILESMSNNTAQNALCTMIKIKAYMACVPHRRVHVTIVTNSFHMRRTRAIFERVIKLVEFKQKILLLLKYEAAKNPSDWRWRKRLEDDVLYQYIDADIMYAFKHRTQCNVISSEGECLNVF